MTATPEEQAQFHATEHRKRARRRPPSTEARQTLDYAMTEKQLQDVIVDLAHLYGWLVMHTRPAYSRGKWSTPIQGDPGFPDLVLARRGVVIFAELKSEKGRPTPNQERWQIAIGSTDVDMWIWRPSDWSKGRIAEVLA